MKARPVFFVVCLLFPAPGLSKENDPLLLSMHQELIKGGLVIDQGDLNQDGHADLILNENGELRIYLGCGNGGFDGSAIPGIKGVGLNGIKVHDLNKDGDPDIVTSGGPQVFVLLGNGDGTFSPGTVYATVDNSTGIAVEDLNGDEIPDLAVGNQVGPRVSVLLGVGDGTFLPPQAHIHQPGRFPRR